MSPSLTDFCLLWLSWFSVSCCIKFHSMFLMSEVFESTQLNSLLPVEVLQSGVIEHAQFMLSVSWLGEIVRSLSTTPLLGEGGVTWVNHEFCCDCRVWIPGGRSGWASSWHCQAERPLQVGHWHVGSHGGQSKVRVRPPDQTHKGKLWEFFTWVSTSVKSLEKPSNTHTHRAITNQHPSHTSNTQSTMIKHTLQYTKNNRCMLHYTQNYHQIHCTTTTITNCNTPALTPINTASDSQQPSHRLR